MFAVFDGLTFQAVLLQLIFGFVPSFVRGYIQQARLRPRIWISLEISSLIVSYSSFVFVCSIPFCSVPGLFEG